MTAVINLNYYELPDDFVGLILRRPSGVVWNHQCGGLSCNQHKAEGVLVAVPAPDVLPDLARLENVWDFGARHADVVDQACARARVPFACLRTAEALDGSTEAWVEGVISHARLADDGALPALAGIPDGIPAVLIWPNSD